MPLSSYHMVKLTVLVLQTERRLAQNREAAKKSRLRKKVLTRSINIPLMIVPSTGAYDCLNLSALLFTGLCAESGDQQGQASADGARAPESTVTGCYYSSSSLCPVHLMP